MAVHFFAAKMCSCWISSARFSYYTRTHERDWCEHDLMCWTIFMFWWIKKEISHCNILVIWGLLVVRLWLINGLKLWGWEKCDRYKISEGEFQDFNVFGRGWICQFTRIQGKFEATAVVKKLPKWVLAEVWFFVWFWHLPFWNRNKRMPKKLLIYINNDLWCLCMCVRVCMYACTCMGMRLQSWAGWGGGGGAVKMYQQASYVLWFVVWRWSVVWGPLICCLKAPLLNCCLKAPDLLFEGPWSVVWRPLICCLKAPDLLFEGPWSVVWRPLICCLKAPDLLFEGPWSVVWRPLICCLKAPDLLFEGPWSVVWRPLICCLKAPDLLFEGPWSVVWRPLICCLKTPDLLFEGPWSVVWRPLICC